MTIFTQLLYKKKFYQEICLQEKFLLNNVKALEKNILFKQNEIARFQSIPLIIGQLIELIDSKQAVVNSTNGNFYVVRILSIIKNDKLKINYSVALNKHSNAIVGVFNDDDIDFKIKILKPGNRPNLKYSEIGGLELQKEEIRESIEFPLTHKSFYEKIGIDLPKGILLYGPPGTGKTMLVKAVAFRTMASFIKTAGSEFVQKFLGEGPKMVRDVFKLAQKNTPCIIFIDEIDAIATKRFDANTGADREVQRILMELLNQMDGFDQNPDLKIIMCTNRIDTLDPALLRPGRIDRKIGFPLPNKREKRFIFKTLTQKMNCSQEIDLEEFILRPDKLTGAIIAAICQEAGIQAIRKNRLLVTQKDFEIAYKINVLNENSILDFYK
jgi:26S proteasome regulatory subunit T3